MPKQMQESVAVLALLMLCAAASVVESNAFTFPVYSAARAFRHRRAVSGEAAAAVAQPTAGPSISLVQQPVSATPAQPPSSPVVAPVPSVTPRPAPAPLMPDAPAPKPMKPVLSPVTAPAPAPMTPAPAPSPAVPAPLPPTPTPAPAAEAPVVQSPKLPAPAPVIRSPPRPSPSPAPAPATPPSTHDSAPPTDTLASGAAGLAASTGAVLVSAVAAIFLC